MHFFLSLLIRVIPIPNVNEKENVDTTVNFTIIFIKKNI